MCSTARARPLLRMLLPHARCTLSHEDLTDSYIAPVPAFAFAFTFTNSQSNNNRQLRGRNVVANGFFNKGGPPGRGVRSSGPSDYLTCANRSQGVEVSCASVESSDKSD